MRTILASNLSCCSDLSSRLCCAARSCWWYIDHFQMYVMYFCVHAVIGRQHQSAKFLSFCALCYSSMYFRFLFIFAGLPISSILHTIAQLLFAIGDVVVASMVPRMRALSARRRFSFYLLLYSCCNHCTLRFIHTTAFSSFRINYEYYNFFSLFRFSYDFFFFALKCTFHLDIKQLSMSEQKKKIARGNLMMFYTIRQNEKSWIYFIYNFCRNL